MTSVVCPIYFPINHWTDPESTIALLWPIDDWLPFVPQAIWVYSFVYLSAAFPLFVVKSPKLFHKVGQSYAISLLLAYLVFLSLPVSAQAHGVKAFRPLIKDLQDTTLTQWAVCMNFYLDKPNNCFPSLHIALAYVTAFSCWVAHRGYGVLAGVVATAIALATMLVKQHYFADVLAGLVLALIAGQRVFRYQAEADEELAQPTWVGALFLPLYFGLLSLFLILWKLDYRPWRE